MYPGDDVAKAAFDVMLTTQLCVVRCDDGFSVMENGTVLGSRWVGYEGVREVTGTRLVWSDPFTALVEAKEWLTTRTSS